MTTLFLIPTAVCGLFKFIIFIEDLDKENTIYFIKHLEEMKLVHVPYSIMGGNP